MENLTPTNQNPIMVALQNLLQSARQGFNSGAQSFANSMNNPNSWENKLGKTFETADTNFRQGYQDMMEPQSFSVPSRGVIGSLGQGLGMVSSPAMMGVNFTGLSSGNSIKSFVESKLKTIRQQQIAQPLETLGAGKIAPKPPPTTTLPQARFQQTDLVKTHPVINIKRDIPVKDIYGNKTVIPQGEALTPYQLTGNKVLLKDGVETIVNKNQFQNIQGNAVKAEAKPFAPELAQTQETIKGDLGYYEKYAASKGWSPAEAVKDKNLLDTPKYGQYTLPGGENYREVLIKAPEAKATMSPKDIKEAQDLIRKINRTPAEETRLQELSKIRSETDAVQNQNFKSSHWDEPNVLSHLRLNDRVTPDGKKVTFIEELQSDWARLARKSKDFEAETGLKTKTLETPPHPLLKNWQELSVKRALKEAVGNNSEYLSWTNGEQQAARYNLGHKLDNISWEAEQSVEAHNIGGRKQVNITTKDGKGVGVNVRNDGIIESGSGLMPQDWVGKRIDEAIGKGVGEKIMAEPKGKLSGEGLNIGGEWAKNLYDNQVKSIVEDLTGGKVETVDMGLPVNEKIQPWGTIRYSNVLKRNAWVELRPQDLKIGMTIGNSGERNGVDYIVTEVLGNGKFKAVGNQSLMSNIRPKQEGEYNRNTITLPNGNKAQYYGTDVKEFEISKLKSTGQQAIKITPEIRAKVLGEAPILKQPSGITPFGK